ncbi:MAG: ankyrin repeat domain-containing protein [Planctomycetota bacterium]
MKNKLNRRSFSRNALGIVSGSLVAAGVGTTNAASAYLLQEEEDAEVRGPVEAEFERDYEAPDFQPSWANPQLNRSMIQDFVIFAHSDLDMTTQLLEREPRLINAAMDWGNGDFETALGGASHMGRKDIAGLLLSNGARIDIFCAAMMGMLATVTEMLTVEPALIDAKGPHGFSLHVHAQAGQEEAAPVLEYLQSIKELELRPLPFLNRNRSDEGSDS